MSEGAVEAGQTQTLFQRWLEPARPRAKFWRLLVGLLLVGVIWVVWQILVIVGWLTFQALASGETWTGPEPDLLALAEGATPPATLVLLASFGGVWIGVFVALHLLHRQGLRSVMSWMSRFRAHEFAVGAGIALAYLFVSAALSILSGGAPLRTMLGIDDWLLMLAPALVLLFVQTGAEELLFRGYMTQQLAARFRNPLVWAGLPSVAFGLIHYANGSSQSHEYGLFYVAATLLMGLIFTALVWRTGGISAAIGMHFANNFGALFVAGTEGPMSSTQLWLWDSSSAAASSMGELGLLALVLAFVMSPWAPLPCAGQIRKPAGAGS